MVLEKRFGLGRRACLALSTVALWACGAPDEPVAVRQQGVDSFVFKKRSTPLVASDARPSDQFGAAIGVSSLWAAIGSPGHDYDPDNPDDDTGRATVFRHTQAGVWEEFAQLAPQQSWPNAMFGTTMAATNELIVVGTPNADPSSDGTKFGAGVVAPFVYRAGAWQAQPFLRDPDEGEEHYFAGSLALADRTLLVGAYGRDQVFVFTHEESGWSEPITIDSPSPAGTYFGFSVALREPFAFIGAPFDDDDGPEDDDRGAVFVYEHVGPTWELRGKLEPKSKSPGDFFGAALAVKDNLLAASAYGDVSVIAFEFDDESSSWGKPQRLASTDVESAADFGRAIAIGVKNTIWVGASRDADYQGVVYPFIRKDGGWSQDLSLSFEDAGAFGFAMASSSGALMVGAPRAGEDLRGAVYVIETSDGTSCSDDDDCFSTHCVKGLCCDSPCTETCRTCVGAEQEDAARDGTCGPVRAGLRPADGGCDDRGAPSCDTNGLCDGEGSCQRYQPGTQCGDPFCSDDDLVGAALCDGRGNCSAPEPSACGNYACSDESCLSGCSGDAECGEAFYCTDGRCRPKLGLGATCESAASCLHGFCADGVCCDRDCQGACEACSDDEEGVKGTCHVMRAGSSPRGEPVAPRPGSDVCSALLCDGIRGEVASMPTSAGTPCSPAGCTDGVEVAEGRCDGSGSCVAPTMRACGAYACSSTEARKGRPEQCLTSCRSVSDCAPDHYCTTDHECRPVADTPPRSHGCSVPPAGRAADSPCLSLFAAIGLIALYRRRDKEYAS